MEMSTAMFWGRICKEGIKRKPTGQMVHQMEVMRISDNREADGIITVVAVDVLWIIIFDVVPIIYSCLTTKRNSGLGRCYAWL
jgi:hypothetical protein